MLFLHGLNESQDNLEIEKPIDAFFLKGILSKIVESLYNEAHKRVFQKEKLLVFIKICYFIIFD